MTKKRKPAKTISLRPKTDVDFLFFRERILGRENPEVPHPVIYRCILSTIQINDKSTNIFIPSLMSIIIKIKTRGAVFADSARFDRCAQLWLHALGLRFVVEHDVFVIDVVVATVVVVVVVVVGGVVFVVVFC